MIYCCRKQAWLWQQGDIFRSRTDPYKMVPRVAVVDDLSAMTRRSPMIRRSVLKSRQEYEVEGDDENASISFFPWSF